MAPLPSSTKPSWLLAAPIQWVVFVFLSKPFAHIRVFSVPGPYIASLKSNPSAHSQHRAVLTEEFLQTRSSRADPGPPGPRGPADSPTEPRAARLMAVPCDGAASPWQQRAFTAAFIVDFAEAHGFGCGESGACGKWVGRAVPKPGTRRDPKEKNGREKKKQNKTHTTTTTVHL